MSSNSGTPEDDSWFLEAHRASSIAIFCVIFIILTFYSIFQCFFYGNPRTSSSRNRASTGDSNEPDHEDHHSIQIQGRGLELWAISSLPMSQFKKSEGEEEKGSHRECAICLGEFEEEEWVKRLPICAHVYHVSCITTWFRSHSNCPLCRSHVIDDHLARSLDSSASALLTTRR